MRPDQTAARIIVHLRRRIEDGVLEGLQVLLVELELEFEGLIRHTPTALEQGKRLVENLLKGHRQLSLMECQIEIEYLVIAYLLGCLPIPALRHLGQAIFNGPYA